MGTRTKEKKTSELKLRITPSLEKMIIKAAQHEDRTVADWVRLVLRNCASANGGRKRPAGSSGSYPV